MGSSPALAQGIAVFERAKQDLYAMLFFLTAKPAPLLVLKHENETGTTGDGRRALQELVSKHNNVTDKVIRANKGQTRQLQQGAKGRSGLILYGEDARAL